MTIKARLLALGWPTKRQCWHGLVCMGLLALGLPNAIAATQSFSYSGPVVAIPDGNVNGTPGAAVNAPITVSGISTPVQKVTVSIDGTACSTASGSTTVGIDHTWVQELVIRLMSPAGTTVTVINSVGADGNNFCQVTLDDDSAGPSIQTITTGGSAPFTGSYKPNTSLSAFAGETANGNWTLIAEDHFQYDTGNIRAWSIHITPQPIQADLAITKTDGVATATPGGSVTYSITASNAGPDAVTGATVADTFPAALTATWTCVGAGGGTCTAAGSGNINDTVNLPAGGSVTYTASATIGAAATGSLSNTATITAPTGVTDPTPANNSATDTDTLMPQADLAITKTDGVATATPGGSTTYTITASNAGPSDAPGATVADTFPAVLTATWTCVGAGGATCPAAGSGNINNTVNLPAGGSVTYTVSASISPTATGTLSNTATIAAPAGVTDPNPGNNSATDTDTLTPQANLAITVTDGVTTAAPGGSVTYTITASNAGPSDAPGATVADTFPAALTATWTCVGAGGGTCPASGSGNINNTVNLPAGGSVTYTVSATISPTATGTLSNTATVSSNVTDPTPGNNTATDTDTLAPAADLSVSTAGSAASAVPGGTAVYVIKASNAGPSPATGAIVSFALPAGWTASWVCAGTGGGICAGSGSNSVADTVNLPAGASVIYTITAQVPLTASGPVPAQATIAAPAGLTDGTPANNTATATVQVQAGLAVSTASLPAGQVQQAYTSTSLAASGGTGALKWTAVSGLPAGMDLSTNGALTGTPTTAGSYSLAVKVEDSGTPTAQTATATLTLVVNSADLTVQTTTLPPATVGVAYNAALVVQGGVAPYRFAVTTGQLPAGLALDAATGTISGTPTATGDTSFAITVADSTAPQATAASAVSKAAVINSVTVSFTMTVAAATTAAAVPVPSLHGLALVLLSLMAGGLGMMGVRWRKQH